MQTASFAPLWPADKAEAMYSKDENAFALLSCGGAVPSELLLVAGSARRSGDQ